ncbi:MAG: S8 family serine peptidase [Candidatus Zixiibacteriota bacterium]
MMSRNDAHRSVVPWGWVFLTCGILAFGVLGHAASVDRAFVRPRNNPVISPWAASVIAQTTREGSVKVWVLFTDRGFYDQRGFAAAATASRGALTSRATSRRAKVGRDRVEFVDIPVRQVYIDRVLDLGATLRQRSRWLNGASFEIAVDRLQDLQALPFVREIRPVMGFRRDPEGLEKESPGTAGPAGVQGPGGPGLNYGPSQAQLDQINVPAAHVAGYRGQGVLVCMMDTGYRKDHVAFAQAYAEARVLAEYDFIFHDGNTQDEPADQPGQHSHGTYTWSTLGGASDGNLYGPAFMSQFILAKTEDIRSETPIEEDNWVAGMEWADSIGAGVISSSLSYKTWDDLTGYVYSDMNGDFCVTTVAADSAAALGIVVCNSAGNSGSNPETMGAPADADSILTVGAVNSVGTIASFSQWGPTYDGRIKPEVCARGVATYCATPTTTTSYGSVGGTSLSCPLVGGGAAVVLSAHPDWTPMQVREALMMTASQAATPNNAYGWGIINVMAAINYTFCQPPAAPGAPVTSMNQPCPDSIYTISWSPVTGATQYELFENDTLVAAVVDTQLTISHPTGTFDYFVKAKDACGTSAAGPSGATTQVVDCPCHADPECDGVASIQDVALVVNEAFRGASPLSDSGCPHVSRCDVDCDCVVGLTDVVKMVDVAFRGGDPATTFCLPCAHRCP